MVAPRISRDDAARAGRIEEERFRGLVPKERDTGQAFVITIIDIGQARQGAKGRRGGDAAVNRAVVGRRTVGSRRVNRHRGRQWVYITSADSDTNAEACLRQPGKAAEVTGDRCATIDTSARCAGKAGTLRQREGEQAVGGGQGGIVAHGEVIAHPVAVDGDGGG